jgi:MFS family permease
MYHTKTHRRFIGLYFLISGVSYSTLMARIPTLKSLYGLNDLELGSLLLTLPAASLIGLPLAGWLISRFSSKRSLAFAFSTNAIMLWLIGLTGNMTMLILAIAVFSFTMRIFSIAVNAQAISLQKAYKKKIIGTFHGLWSLGGILGIIISTLMVAQGVTMAVHFAVIALLNLILTLFSVQYLLKDDNQGTGSKLKFGKPDTLILYLGIIAFAGAICEGAMFDWSGVYFKEVLHVKIFTYGYLVFMTFMTLSRFISDTVMTTIGLKKYYLLNGLLIGLGMILPSALPTFFWAVLGFSLVGIGTAPIVPMTYILATSHSPYAPSVSISLIATYSLMGMFLGPPLVGFLAHLFNLRISFLALSLIGICILPIAIRFFRHSAAQVPINHE